MALDPQIVSELREAILRHVRSRQRGNVTLTYADVISGTGRKLTEQGIGGHLTAIGNLCEANGQPRLDYLVVKKTTGMPGIEVDRVRWLEETERCRRFPWPLDQSA